jgi:hypothetical protein
MKLLNKLTISVIIVLMLVATVMFYNALKYYKKVQVTYDMPEEFNPKIISHDRTDPTEMMVVYDTLKNTYIFEFIDK